MSGAATTNVPDDYDKTEPTKESAPKRLKTKESSGSDDVITGVAVGAESSAAAAETLPPPLYGSQEYWETRYEKQFRELQQHKKDDDTLPYHAWYYTYDDLRPLIMPLIIGGRNDHGGDPMQLHSTEEDEADVQQNPKDADQSSFADANDASTGGDNELDEIKDVEEDGDQSPEKPSHPTGLPGKLSSSSSSKTTQKDEEKKEDSDDSSPQDEEAEDANDKVQSTDELDDDFEEYIEDDDDEEDDDDDEEPHEREGLAKNGPISVLEIGCGDVPLGTGLAIELHELQENTERSVRNVVKRILCTDYSTVVVDMMKKQYRQGVCPDDEKGRSNKPSTAASNPTEVCVYLGDAPIEFEAVDARNLPYDVKSFELILEKGTLDAMLSDKVNGVQNCIKIVAECARVLTTGGFIVLVSHLNAHNVQGVGWLEEVVFGGLKMGDDKALWRIEVHGKNEEQEEDGQQEISPVSSHGPAVYIINKLPPLPDGSTEKSSVSVKLYAY